MSVSLRPVDETDEAWVRETLEARWGEARVVSRGAVWDPVALRFYQRRGFVLAALHREALAESRRLKPSIPEIGAYGIPLRDELELERRLRS